MILKLNYLDNAEIIRSAAFRSSYLLTRCMCRSSLEALLHIQSHLFFIEVKKALKTVGSQNNAWEPIKQRCFGKYCLNNKVSRKKEFTNGIKSAVTRNVVVHKFLCVVKIFFTQTDSDEHR